MEYFVNNSHKNRIEIAGFVRQALRNRPATNSLIGSCQKCRKKMEKLIGMI